jgi:hypothetical protein
MELISNFLRFRFDITKCESFQKIRVSGDPKAPAEVNARHLVPGLLLARNPVIIGATTFV